MTGLTIILIIAGVIAYLFFAAIILALCKSASKTDEAIGKMTRATGNTKTKR